MRRFIHVLFAVLLIACQNQSPDDFDAQTEIEKLMMLQEAAWNDGDLERFMQPYWKSDSLLFIGSRGPTYGWQTTLNNYKESYPTPKKMGRLQFQNISYKPLGKSHYWVAGKWTLFRSADTLSGHYTLLWKNTKNGWKIVADHSS